MEAFITALLERLQREPDCRKAEHRVYAGVDFFYLTPAGLHWGERMKQLVIPLLEGTEVSFNCRHIRRSRERSVYRIHFRMPLEKSFCCGNQCVDCILFKNQ